MSKLRCLALVCFFILLTQLSRAQNTYHVVPVSDGGTISGRVKWVGIIPPPQTFPVTKDSQICDPESHKKVSLDRLIIGSEGGVANTIVYLKNVTSGKAMDLPQPRRFLDQKHCRYEPHILVVPETANLQMKSSDATLHTIHMDGAATYNLPFPFQNQVVSRAMSTPGLVNLKCNGGHVWMNAEMMVVSHPYYAVTDETGHFELTNVPPGRYQIVAWHEGWGVSRHETAFDVLTENKVERPVFTEPRVWEKNVAVDPNGKATIDFSISEK